MKPSSSHGDAPSTSRPRLLTDDTSPKISPSKQEPTPPHLPLASYCVGDVVWVKESRYPWWPCQVSEIATCRTDYKGHTTPVIWAKFCKEESWSKIIKWKNVQPFRCKREELIALGKSSLLKKDLTTQIKFNSAVSLAEDLMDETYTNHIKVDEMDEAKAGSNMPLEQENFSGTTSPVENCPQENFSGTTSPVENCPQENFSGTTLPVESCPSAAVKVEDITLQLVSNSGGNDTVFKHGDTETSDMQINNVITICENKISANAQTLRKQDLNVVNWGVMRLDDSLTVNDKADNRIMPNEVAVYDQSLDSVTGTRTHILSSQSQQLCHMPSKPVSGSETCVVQPQQILATKSLFPDPVLNTHVTFNSTEAESPQNNVPVPHLGTDNAENCTVPPHLNNIKSVSPIQASLPQPIFEALSLKTPFSPPHKSTVPHAVTEAKSPEPKATSPQHKLTEPNLNTRAMWRETKSLSPQRNTALPQPKPEVRCRRRSAPESSNHLMNNYRKGDVVWVKLSIYPWWPAQVDAKCESVVGYDGDTRTVAWVTFFTEKSTEKIVDPKKILPFHCENQGHLIEQGLSSRRKGLFEKDLGHAKRQQKKNKSEKLESKSVCQESCVDGEISNVSLISQPKVDSVENISTHAYNNSTYQPSITTKRGRGRSAKQTRTGKKVNYNIGVENASELLTQPVATKCMDEKERPTSVPLVTSKRKRGRPKTKNGIIPSTKKDKINKRKNWKSCPSNLVKEPLSTDQLQENLNCHRKTLKRRTCQVESNKSRLEPKRTRQRSVSSTSLPVIENGVVTESAKKQKRNRASSNRGFQKKNVNIVQKEKKRQQKTAAKLTNKRTQNLKDTLMNPSPPPKITWNPANDTSMTLPTPEPLSPESASTRPSLKKISGRRSLSLNSDEEDDEPDLPEGLSPVIGTFPVSEKDIIWAKYFKEPFWPCFVTRIYRKKKKVSKVSMVFIEPAGYPMERITMTYKPHTIVPFNDSRREDFIKNGQLLDTAENRDRFLEAMARTEDYLNKKALGLLAQRDLQFFFPDGIDLDEEDDTEIVSSGGQSSPSSSLSCVSEALEELSAAGQKRLEKIKENNKPLVDCILSEKTKEYLIQVYNKKVKSERHDRYHSGVRGKVSLRHAGFGPIADESQQDEISFKLIEWFSEASRTPRNRFPDSDYVVDVWIPEAVVFALMKVRKYDRKRAWKKFFRGVPMTKEEKQNMHKNLLQSAKNISQTDREYYQDKFKRKMEMAGLPFEDVEETQPRRVPKKLKFS